MLKKLGKEDVAGQTLMKSSAQRSIKAQVGEEKKRFDASVQPRPSSQGQSCGSESFCNSSDSARLPASGECDGGNLA